MKITILTNSDLSIVDCGPLSWTLLSSTETVADMRCLASVVLYPNVIHCAKKNPFFCKSPISIIEK